MMTNVNTLSQAAIYNLFHVKQLKKRPCDNSKMLKGKKYKDLVCAFDIETTRLTNSDIDENIPEFDQSIMYIWQFCVDGKITIYGRTWEEFMQFLEYAKRAMCEKTFVVVYVHNLSYEFQFLSGIYPFTKDEVFAVDSRKVLKCEMLQHFEFRCSYLHSNMSLDEYTKKMGVNHKKLSGFNYSKKRFPWTKLEYSEFEYYENDVLGLVEALKIEMKHDGDNLYSIPLTSTGYVRRDAKAAIKHTPKGYLTEMFPDWHTYELLRRAFRGGNTHANRYFVGQVLHDVNSADRSSSYPDVLCNKKFPVSRFIYDKNLEFDHIIDVMNRSKRACLIKFSVSNVRLHDKFWGCPYLSRSKCQEKAADILNGVYDNGRIISADHISSIVMTDIDFRIFLREYDFDDLEVVEFAHARYGNLPPAFVQEIQKYYTAKTSLKNVPGQELYYTKSKNKLNSLYGMCAQNPAKQQFLYTNGESVFELDKEKTCQTILEEKAQHPFLPYQWGVWCTAWARSELEEMIEEVYKQGAFFVYTDTDSVKYLGEVVWTEYNNNRIKASTASGSFADDPSGERHYMGVAEQEWFSAFEFATLGAKKYCYRLKQDSKLVTTIAGVSKKTGGAELEQYGGISAFKDGFVFTESGGLESRFNDHINMIIHVNGKPVHITNNISLRPSTYTLGREVDYFRLCTECSDIFRLDKDWNYVL